MFTFILCGVAVFSAISIGHASVVRPSDQHLEQNILSLQVDPDEGVCLPDCDSQIFCQGEFLHDVQMHVNLDFPKKYDSKTFVDMKLERDEAEILREYKALKENDKLKFNLTKFVKDNFASVNLSLDTSWSPPDFPDNETIANLPLVKNIMDEKYQVFAKDLIFKWNDLAAKVSEDVKIHSDRHSAIYLPKGFIKAGGRFREMYYWDSYWIIRGLLLSNMTETARGMIENMFELVKTYGHIPNGARKYYLGRSQPPLLMKMAEEYYTKTQNYSFIIENLVWFETEFQFWYTKRTVTITKDGREYIMARYNAPSCSPRPESYQIDFNNSRKLSKSERTTFFTALKSAAETGWDFSSRYIRGLDGLSPGFNLTDLDTTSFILVDLNSILHYNAKFLGKWFAKAGAAHKSKIYNDIANNLFEAIEKVLWNDEAGVWLDWDIKSKESRNYFYPSNLAPLWTDSFGTDVKSKKKKVADVLKYLKDNNITSLDDKNLPILAKKYWGVPTSLQRNISEQWDYPNGWAPLEAIVIQGLQKANYSEEAGNLALDIAQKWVKTNYDCYLINGTKHMHEKYDVTNEGTFGGAGEYEAQTGFGWTNGFVLELFDTYGKKLDSTYGNQK